jgi:putative transposase
VVISGANVVDHKLLSDTLDAIVVERPAIEEVPQENLCLDKGYDNKPTRELIEEYAYTPHIRSIRDEDKKVAGKKHKPRRWVVERTLSWLNRCRAILIRWDKKARNYLALLKLACALLWFRRLHKLAF